jgi:serine phosphatase RsbU (regulator of sigma subunit)
MQPNHLTPLPGRAGNGAPGAGRADLESARRVQQRLWPGRLPHVGGWDFAAFCRPARSVGGDYHDLFEVGPGRLALALGDVSGKGLGPALVMAHLHALVRTGLPAGQAHLPRFAGDLNGHLGAFLPEDFFVTLFLAVLDLGSGRLDYVNAGHPAPLLVGGRGSAAVGLDRGGAPLGPLPGASYQGGRALLAPGGVLALFSDGLTEARNAGGEMFHARRVGQVLQAGHGRWAGDLLRVLVDAVGTFARPPHPADDLTLMVVRRERGGPAADGECPGRRAPRHPGCP